LRTLTLAAVLLLSLSCKTEPPPLEAVFVAPRVKTARAPVLLMLHGVGSNERDLVGLVDSVDPRFAVYSLRAPLVLGEDRFGWYPVQFTPRGPTHDPAEAERSRARLSSFIRQLAKNPELDASRVYLLGFSQGAIMSLAVALTEPRLISGVVALSGRLLPELKPNGGPPVFLAHGRQDAVIPFSAATEAKAALEGAGVQVEFFPSEGGHQIDAATRAAMGAWLSARLGSAPAQ